MSRRVARLALAAALIALSVPAAGAPPFRPVEIVAAERVYGDIAGQVGGDLVHTTVVLDDPNGNPHRFEPPASAATAIAGAALIVENGAGYDPWMNRLVAQAHARSRVIDAGRLTGSRRGDNPHLWADPATIRRVARAIAARLSPLVPADRRAGIATRLAALEHGLDQVEHRIAQIAAAHAGDRVAATEPLFGPTARRLGLRMVDRAFQEAVMNGTTPDAQAAADLERDLQDRTVRVLFVDRQVGEESTTRLVGIAQRRGVPIVALTETEPALVNYQHWLLAELDATDSALGPRH